MKLIFLHRDADKARITTLAAQDRMGRPRYIPAWTVGAETQQSSELWLYAQARGDAAVRIATHAGLLQVA